FLAKFDSSGKVLWAKRFGDAASQFDGAIAVDHADNILFTGFFAGAIDFGHGPLTSAGGVDMFAAKLDPSGKPLWAKRFGDTSDQYGWGIAADASGNVLVTGFFGGAIDFGGGPLMSAGGLDIVVAKLDPSGGYLWGRRFGDLSDQAAYSMAVDSAG